MRRFNIMEVTPIPKPARVKDEGLLEAYHEVHPWCEVCGRPAMRTPHHLKTRGSGGGDEWENLMSLCLWHHDAAHHKPGYNQRLKERKREAH